MSPMRALLPHLRGNVWIALVFSTSFGLSALAQTAPATTQVPAGSVAAIGKRGAPNAAAPTPPESKKMLKEALSPATRKTLQEAMDATPAPK